MNTSDATVGGRIANLAQVNGSYYIDYSGSSVQDPGRLGCWLFMAPQSG